MGELVSLKVDKSTLTDDLSIAESMNSYFSSVFTTEDYHNFPSIELKVVNKLSRIHCSTKELEALLTNLNTYKSPRPDLIPPRILKECAKGLAPSLCALLNISFSSGQLPSGWKLANITPIHKKGPKNCRENNRQISLTSIVCKLGEKNVKDRLVNFWKNSNIFNSNQFGYLKGKSTLTQLLSCYNDWAKSRNTSPDTDVFLDFSKAFDSVTHKRLLLKLESNGIDSALLQWL